MAVDGKITSLTSIPAIDRSADVLEIVDISANTSNKVTPNFLLGISGNPVGDTDSQTLSAKILTAPTINSATISGTLSGTYTIGGTPTFPTSVVTLTGSQVLTNKTLTSPTISSPTITNASITQDSVVGFTTANSGTVYGVAFTTGSISGASLSAGTVGATALATNAVQASQLATSAISLGYTPITSNFSTSSTTAVQVTGLTTTVTIPSGGRRVKITAFARDVFDSTNAAIMYVSIWDGVVGSGTQLSQWQESNPAGLNTIGYGVHCVAIHTPAAGSKTYNVSLHANTGTVFIEAAATYPAFISVEVI